MGSQNDIIELNGNKYNAKTGTLIGTVAANTGMVQRVDGFSRRSRPTVPANITPKKPTPSHTVHKKTTKSQTLMRSAVKKPTTKQSAPTMDARPIETRSIAPNAERMKRATELQRSPHVSKFGTLKPAIAPLKVRQEPPVTAPVQSIAETESPRPLLPLSPFDMALSNARSHEQPAIKPQSIRQRIAKRLRVTPRAASITGGVVLVVAVSAFLAQQHVPQVSVRLAAARAGVQAKLPGYKPAGFSLSGPIEYSAGQITLAYQSNTDDRNFRVVQKKSDWNSQSLLENFIASSSKSYQTFQDKGKTIYIYDNNNATWVSGGIWYQVEGESSLNSDQLLRIASGL